VTYYVMGEITVHSMDWVTEYLQKVGQFINKYKGRVLSRSLKMEIIEGERDLPANVILIEFPTKNAALSFFNDPDYQPVRRLRREGSRSEFILFPAEDIAIPKFRLNNRSRFMSTYGRNPGIAGDSGHPPSRE